METLRPTDSELEILQVLWEKGACTVREVNDVLGTRREIGYTTTLKLMQIMHEKGLLLREKDGRGHVYASAAKREVTQRALLDRFLENAFAGSAMQLVLQTLGGHKASPAEIDQIRAYLDTIEKDSTK
ncbi:MAG: BlaI/MecI/CopY family transcriptional regulator [Bacteroidetes bacterium]|nr:BlaI/MecI/CopY family transcriptional regulator [Bacteroidota bacterium]MBL0019856.1 BlaI/MecI/CopY family transcriptional regulator [Bacteroidota bacterium]